MPPLNDFEIVLGDYDVRSVYNPLINMQTHVDNNKCPVLLVSPLWGQ